MVSDSRFATCQGRNTASSSLDKEYQWHIIYIIKEIKVPEFTSLDVPPKKWRAHLLCCSQWEHMLMHKVQQMNEKQGMRKDRKCMYSSSLVFFTFYGYRKRNHCI